MQDEWWYASGGVRKGPVKFEDLRQKVLEGSLSTGDLVWTAGMSQWTAASDVPALQELLQSLQPPELPPQLPHEFPPELPKPARPELRGSFVATEPLPLETPAPTPEPAGPWRRFFARYIDFWVIGLPTVFLVVFFLASVWPGFDLWLQQAGSDVVLGFLVIPLVLVIEAVIFELFGTTIGKGLLGIHVTTARSKTPTFLQYLYRQLIVYWYGLGIGFPLVSFFTQYRQYRRLNAGMAASYDEGFYKVTSSKVGAARYVLAVLLVVVAMSVSNGVFLLLDRADSNRGKDSTGYPTVSESQRTNPVVAPTPQLHPGQVLKDCADCPDMVVIPAGSFMMGSSITEQQLAQKGGVPKELTDLENPQHRVSVRSFAVGKYAVTRGQFSAFVQARSYITEAERGNGCVTLVENEWMQAADKNWRNPGFSQTEFHPVVCVSWNDAQAYVQWLSQITGRHYRLLSEAEREYVARAGSQTAFWWGDSISTTQANYEGNYSYNDSLKDPFHHQTTLPVGSFSPNPYGLYNVHGNVWEWVQDCIEGNYSQGHPADGSAHRGNDVSCPFRAQRGGAWNNSPANLRSANRFGRVPDARDSTLGFRVAKAVP